MLVWHNINERDVQYLVAPAYELDALFLENVVQMHL